MMSFLMALGLPLAGTSFALLLLELATAAAAGPPLIPIRGRCLLGLAVPVPLRIYGLAHV